MYDPADYDADTAAIGRIFLNGLRLATMFISVGWLLKAARIVDDAHVELPNT